MNGQQGLTVHRSTPYKGERTVERSFSPSKARTGLACARAFGGHPRPFNDARSATEAIGPGWPGTDSAILPNPLLYLGSSRS